jgi:dynein heavy chain
LAKGTLPVLSVPLFLEEVKTDIGIEDYVDPLCRMEVKIHRSVEVCTTQYYSDMKRTTPTSDLELMRLHIDILKQQKEIAFAKESRYRGYGGWITK